MRRAISAWAFPGTMTFEDVFKKAKEIGFEAVELTVDAVGSSNRSLTTETTETELAEIKAQVDDYKEIEDLVLFGDLYRLNDPQKENLFAEQLVSKDRSKALVTVMRPLAIPNAAAIRVYPRGLDDDATYFVCEGNLTKKGSTLMNLGIIVPFAPRDFSTVTYHIKKVD